jgi:hypothetical protein
MSGLELLSQPHTSDMRTHPQLDALRIQAAQKWPALPPPIISTWSDSPVVGLDRNGMPWVIAPADRDPLRDSRGRTVIPRQQQKRLKRIAELDIPFQRLAIAHELNHNGPVRNLLQELEEGPRTSTDEIARTLVGEIPTHPGVTRAIRVLDAAVRGATSAIPINAAITLLDPIIYGVIAPTPLQQGQPCLWYQLVAWRW